MTASIWHFSCTSNIILLFSKPTKLINKSGNTLFMTVHSRIPGIPGFPQTCLYQLNI